MVWAEKKRKVERKSIKVCLVVLVVCFLFACILIMLVACILFTYASNKHTKHLFLVEIAWTPTVLFKLISPTM